MKKSTTPVRMKSLLILLGACFTTPGLAQVGDVLWEENFNTFNTEIWNPIEGDGCPGLCGWGNAELEYYTGNNISIEDVPGEPGNKALVLQARNETQGSRAFTSGKVDTEDNLSVHYGLIEIRMRVPDLETGLWPAAWLLGTTSLAWPAKGEIDLMEMGQKYEERNYQGFPASTVNNFVGANAIFQTTDGQYGSIAYDVYYNQPYVPATPLNDRFVTYRLYWEPTSMRFTVVDGGTEYDLYTNPLPIDAEGNTEEFTRPFYLLLNLAVGGNFTDAASNAQVTAPLPAKMYVDYIRVSEWNGYGEVAFNYGALQPESGVLGLYTDTTPTTNELVYGSDAAIYVWEGTLQEGTTPPYEGSNVIAWESTSANSWFGAGIASLYGKNMSGFVENGSLKFKIKIPAAVSFRIGITDNYTNQSYVDFPANQTTYGLVRNGEWGQVEIPLQDFAGLIAFQDIGYLLAITSDVSNLPTSTFQLALDDIIWDDGNGTTVTLTSITVSPSNTVLSVNETQQFAAQAYDQYNNPMNASFSWSATGGTITTSGLFTATDAGQFTITASNNGVIGQTEITVNTGTAAISLPGTLQAQDYKEGGEGSGYHDTSSGNTGGAYRGDDVDIEVTGDALGDYNVGWIESGEWLAYDVHVDATGTYDLGVRVASPGGGSMHIEMDGINVSGTLNVPVTGSWQSYATLSAPGIALTQGMHEMRMVFETAGFNVNYLEVTEASTSTPGGCTLSGPNGDYTVTISEDSGNTSLTFEPGATGIGDPTAILYYSTNPNVTFPGYGVTPGVPELLNISSGQTVYFYYTYSVPEGGERNSSASPHSYVAGSCSNNNRVASISGPGNNFPVKELLIYPNPASEILHLTLPEGYQHAEVNILDVMGRKLQYRLANETNNLLNINNLLPGIYFIQVSTPDQPALVTRFVRK